MHFSTLSRGLMASALGATLGLSLASCGPATPREDVVVATQGPPAGLDFTSIGGAAAPQALMGNIYETLVRIDANGEPQPWLATSWRVSDDGTVYTFDLREGVTFSDGSPFDASDAVFSINYVKDSWVNGIKENMDPVASARAVDPRTLEVTLKAPSEQWLWSMGTMTGAMMTPDSVGRLARNPLGTGPYTLRSFEPGHSIAFDPRPDYWGTKPQSGAMIRYFGDAIAAVNALRVGDVDVVWAMQAPQLLDALPDDITTAVGTTNGEVIFSMNNKAAPFDDVTVRRAAAYAIDRDALNAVVYNGLATDTGGAPVPPTDPWFTGTNYYPFDPDKARELLAGRTPEVTIEVPSLPYAQTASELIYSQLRSVGFRVTLHTVEFPAVWLNKVHKQHDYQASIISHVEPRDMVHMFGNPDYYFGYDSAHARELMAQGDLQAAVDTIMADAGALTLVNAPNIVLYAPGVHGLDPNVVTDSLPLNEVRR